MRTHTDVRRFESTKTEPHSRGIEFGSANADRIAQTVDRYRRLFAVNKLGPQAVGKLSDQAFDAIESWSPDIAREIQGIADGAALPVRDIAMINARTEILAHSGIPTPPECSTIVQLCDEYPLAQQNWDWYSTFEDSWLVWRFTTEAAVVVETMTEYGVVAKAGCNSAGLGVLFNILHHDQDGHSMGVPVHVISRRVLAEATDVAHALSLIAGARRSASTTMTVVHGAEHGSQAVSVEVAPHDLGFVFPDDGGLLVHTNHFLTEQLRGGDREHREYPDTVLRYDTITRKLRSARPVTAEAAENALSDTTGGPLAVCCRPDDTTPAEFQYKTLAHVSLDLKNTCTDVTPFDPAQLTRSPADISK